MPKKFLVFAPSYNPEGGGDVVLHRLCAILNELGHEAWLHPYFSGMPAYPNNIPDVARSTLKWFIAKHFFRYRTRPDWNTPVLKRFDAAHSDDWIVIYPEIVFGNPLRAKNVVRWLLYKPGFHTGQIFYGSNDLLVSFNEFSDDFHFPGAHKSASRLYVLSFPFEHYNLEGALPPEQRSGTAYCLRKGKGRPIVHDLDNSILIDGMSHAEVASVFKRVKTFISYDLYTAFSSFAVLCGTASVVIPEPGRTREGWYENRAETYGVAYGFDDLAWARETADKVLGRLREKEALSIESVRQFVTEANQYFSRT